MNLECRVQHLELQYESLDGTVRKILVYTKNTHEILMSHISESNARLDRLEKDVSELKREMSNMSRDMAEVKEMLKVLIQANAQV